MKKTKVTHQIYLDLLKYDPNFDPNLYQFSKRNDSSVLSKLSTLYDNTPDLRIEPSSWLRVNYLDNKKLSNYMQKHIFSLWTTKNNWIWQTIFWETTCCHGCAFH